MNVKNTDLNVIKKTYINCDKNAYDVLNESIFKQLNNEMKIITNDDFFLNEE